MSINKRRQRLKRLNKQLGKLRPATEAELMDKILTYEDKIKSLKRCLMSEDWDTALAHCQDLIDIAEG